MKKKKWRDVKNALVMVVVMAAMMSTATYAWFTLTSNATVTGMQMTAGGSSGLKVSLTGTDGWKDAVSMETVDENGDVVTPMINQVTIKAEDGNAPTFVPTFYKPFYEDKGGKSTVTRVDAISKADLNTYVAKYTYYLRTESVESAPVGITYGKLPEADALGGLDANGMPVIEGSYVRALETADTDTAAYAVRIGFVVDGKMYVWEPNSDKSIAGTAEGTDYAYEDEAVSGLTYTPNAKSKADGTDDAGDNESDALFTATAAGTKVEMYVWLEGCDDDCVNQIKADDIEAQVQFTIINE